MSFLQQMAIPQFFILLSAFFLGFIAIAAGLTFYIWSIRTEGPGTLLARILGLFITIISFLQISCLSFFGVQYWYSVRAHDPMETILQSLKVNDPTRTLNQIDDNTKKFYALGDAAKNSFNEGKIQDAENDATELLKMAPKFRNDWNYGNAIQDGNIVLGRIAVRNGHIEEAKKYLLEAGKSPGSPQMDSFGPNMSLAKDLLEKGERDTVLQYFELCRTFWKMGSEKLDQWSNQVKAGQTPDFGANLLY